ncbi:hypothetical protein RD110_11065 [Rhodoferax koreense]|uniref:Uncharacterized protein n=1 Tax=Rhodoferax koreensis TaxID=1842727 RepID=A0A1P8JV92_9BURK|nr:hypothetical protein [Rhodoferax koreense]APW37667.1 hypothetical protein RD110_11065 [Rhodoferax koreense]
MTKDEIIETARKAGFLTGKIDYAGIEGAYDVVQSRATGNMLAELTKFAELVEQRYFVATTPAELDAVFARIEAGG